jgi:hypothetical protein
MVNRRFFILHLGNIAYIVTEWHYFDFVPSLYYYRIDDEIITFKLVKRGKKLEHYERV